MRRNQLVEAARHLFFAAALAALTAFNTWLMANPVSWVRMNLGWHWAAEAALGFFCALQVHAFFDALRDDGQVAEDDGITCDCGPVHVRTLQSVPPPGDDDEEELWACTCDPAGS